MTNSMFSYEDNSFVKMILSSYNVLVHLLLGVLIAVPLLYAVVQNFNITSAPYNVITLHILLCVLGYQLLMSQAFLSLCNYNAWSSHLKKSNRIHAHWILQLLGSTMAITGSVVIMLYKDNNFDTTHGKLGLVAVIFTALTLLTGVPTFFSNSLKRFIPSSVSKLTHIVMGITTFALATSCLCHGYNQFSFRAWTGDRVTNGVIAFTGIFTFIMIVNPLITMCKSIYSVVEAYRTRMIRRALVGAIGGGDLSRRALVQAMVRSEEEWQAVASFCEAVMLVKEEADRVRQRSSRPRPRRRDSNPDFRPP